MTPKEKAEDLVEYFWHDVEEVKRHEVVGMTKQMAKDCAIKVAKELIEATRSGLGHTVYSKKYWGKVKAEIGKL